MASTTARAWAAPTPSTWPSPITCRVTPHTRRSASCRRSTTRACSRTSMPGSSWTAWRAAISAREISRPVASPPAWAIRSRWWPPSRVREISPSGPRSNSVPRPTSSRTRAGPSDTRARTASTSQTPAPATRVSRRCSCGESAGSRAAAMPPWAHSVEPSESTVLVTSSTRSTRCRSRNAAVRPAMPDPTTMTSAEVVHPGAGATSRPGTVRVTGRRRGRPREWERPRARTRTGPGRVRRPRARHPRAPPPRGGCR